MAKKGEKEEELITIKKIVKTRSKQSTPRKSKPAKKRRKKRAKKTTKTVIIKNDSIEKILVQNFVSLQEVMTNLSIKFDSLSKGIAQLLGLFEKSASALMEKDLLVTDLKKDEKKEKETKEIIEGLNRLLEQNKVLARGLILLHESNQGYKPQQIIPIPQMQPPMQMPQQMQTPQFIRPSAPEAPVQKEQDSGSYQKSISSENKNA